MKRTNGIWTGIIALTLVAAGSIIGCEGAYPNALRAADGTPIRIEEIVEILGQEELTEDEKKDLLRELGITDEMLLDYLFETLQP